MHHSTEQGLERTQKFQWRSVKVIYGHGGVSLKSELHVSWQSIPDISLVFVRYTLCHASHPWFIQSLHLRGDAPACAIISGSDGGLMACTLYTAINLFIGHLPASWRYISSCACMHVSESRTIQAIAWCVQILGSKQCASPCTSECPCEKCLIIFIQFIESNHDGWKDLEMHTHARTLLFTQFTSGYCHVYL